MEQGGNAGAGGQIWNNNFNPNDHQVRPPYSLFSENQQSQHDQRSLQSAARPQTALGSRIPTESGSLDHNIALLTAMMSRIESSHNEMRNDFSQWKRDFEGKFQNLNEKHNCLASDYSNTKHSFMELESRVATLEASRNDMFARIYEIDKRTTMREIEEYNIQRANNLIFYDVQELGQKDTMEEWRQYMHNRIGLPVDTVKAIEPTAVRRARSGKDNSALPVVATFKDPGIITDLFNYLKGKDVAPLVSKDVHRLCRLARRTVLPYFHELKQFYREVKLYPPCRLVIGRETILNMFPGYGTGDGGILEAEITNPDLTVVQARVSQGRIMRGIPDNGGFVEPRGFQGQFPRLPPPRYPQQGRGGPYTPRHNAPPPTRAYPPQGPSNPTAARGLNMNSVPGSAASSESRAPQETQNRITQGASVQVPAQQPNGIQRTLAVNSQRPTEAATGDQAQDTTEQQVRSQQQEDVVLASQGQHGQQGHQIGTTVSAEVNTPVTSMITSDRPAKIVSTVPQHSDRVNSCRWISRGPEPENELTSSSTDKSVIVWKTNETSERIGHIARLIGHTGAVTVAEGVYVTSSNKPRTLIASASVDSSVRIWEREEDSDEFSCTQTLSFGTGFALDLSWVILPNTEVPLLVCGGDDQRIHIFVEQNNQLVSVQTLLGHEDWIRSISLTVGDNGDILLATCAQDCYIRIWRISPRDPEEALPVQSISELSLEEDIKLKEDTFSFVNKGRTLCYAVFLESVLHGHENWVYSIQWQPPVYTGNQRHQPMCLLSASMDKTLVLWKPDTDTGVWVEHVRVGEVGGGNLGFYGGLFSPNGKSILSHGFQGAFHIWNQEQDTESWLPGVTTGGHFDCVNDICWSLNGYYLLSAGSDQTTRLHAYWKSEIESESCWHEIARPQVHGYDMQCLAMINNFMFASGADEKVVRIFGAPKNYLENFSKISRIDVTDTLRERDAAKLPEGASVPALGLSNKAVYEGESQEYVPTEGRQVEANPNAQYPEIYFSPLSLSQPPSEDNLLQNTLWPEVQKLYGHGYEIFALACDPDGSILATSCKAAKAEHAFIILWDVKTWKQTCQLSSHTLTVTQLAFSHSGDRLLSVSRDRTWTVYKRKGEDEEDAADLFRRVAFTDKKTAIHSRIIWSCDWSHDDKYFVTVSRDKKAVVWLDTGITDDNAPNLAGYKACSSTTLPDSVTAVAFAPVKVNDSYVLAFGLDNGTIHAASWQPPSGEEGNKWQDIHIFDKCSAHHLTVKRLCFRPNKDVQAPFLHLASCASDNMVKIYEIPTS